MTPDNSIHAFQKGIGNSMRGSTIPAQAIPDSKKTKFWKHATIDAIERIGEKQFLENQSFLAYYSMIQGRTTYIGTDFQDFPELGKGIKMLREEVGLPTFLKHYDIIGIVVNVLAGIYTDFKDIFRVDSVDEYATNEFIRQKTERLQQYAAETFQLELNKLLVMRGMDPDVQEFSSEEEKQAYLQNLDQQRKALTPTEIEAFMGKNFKVLATEWAENVIKEDTKRFYLDELDREEFIDYLITGRWFRHYRVGYDSYSPETWSPINTFFSSTVDTRYPQDGEFVGRIHFYSPADILNLYGHMLTLKEQEAISNYWGQGVNYVYGGNETISPGRMHSQVFPETHIVPFENYYQHDLLKKYEDALGQPLGERTVFNQDGTETTYNDWLPEYNNGTNTFRSSLAKTMRNDIDVDSSIQVTEGYWRSSKRLGMLTYEDEESGQLLTVIVTDDLLSDFITENEIKKLRNVSLDEYQKALKENRQHEYVNTIIYTYSPEVRRFVKIKNTSATLEKDIYLYGEPLEYQIRTGNSENYDFKLPVGGYIGDSTVLKIAPDQVMYNICYNQVYNLLEKEIGIFFLMDINYIPSEYMENGDTEDALLQLRDFAKDVGLLPADLSRQNLQGQQPFNSFIRQDLTYGTQVEYRMALAQGYKMSAFEKVGITPQMLGQPNKYVTAEGVQQGAQASQAQLMPIFEKMSTSKLKCMEIHLAVAQYCQSNNKDRSVFYRKSDGDHYFLDIMKEDGELFPLRFLGIMPVSSTKDRKLLENVKSIYANNNTITNDVQDVFDIMRSDTIIDLQTIAKESRARIQQQTQAQRDFESEQLNKQLQLQEQQKQAELATLIGENQKDRDSKEEIAYMNNIGRTADNNSSPDALNMLKLESQNILTSQRNAGELATKSREITRKEKADKWTQDQQTREFGLKEQELQLKKQQNQDENFRAVINKN